MVTLQVPVHPGEILKHEFLEPMGLSAIGLAKHIRVPRTRIERLVREETAVTVDTAKRLARAFGTSVEFWLNLQMHYNLLTADPANEIMEIKPLRVA